MILILLGPRGLRFGAAAPPVYGLQRPAPAIPWISSVLYWNDKGFKPKNLGYGKRPSWLRKLDHAADPVLGLHQLEPAVDLVEPDPVGDERLDVDFPGQVAVDQDRNLVAALDAAEGGAGDAAAGDQKARDDVEGLSPAGHSGDGAQPPAHPRRLDRLAHHRDVAGRLEGVVSAEAAGQLEDPLDRPLPALEQVR